MPLYTLNPLGTVENGLMEGAASIDAVRPHLQAMAQQGNPHAYAALELAVVARALMTRACRTLNNSSAA